MLVSFGRFLQPPALDERVRQVHADVEIVGVGFHDPLQKLCGLLPPVLLAKYRGKLQAALGVGRCQLGGALGAIRGARRAKFDSQW